MEVSLVNKHKVKIYLDDKEYDYLKSHSNMSEKIRSILHQHMDNEYLLQQELLNLDQKCEKIELDKHYLEKELIALNKQKGQLQKRIGQVKKRRIKPEEYPEIRDFLIAYKEMGNTITQDDINFQAQKLGVEPRYMKKWLEEDEVI
ncbi:MAG: hypothetical protein BZ136_09305 [Methanosphaera sp. rholeuAM74]|nr:MAG: hypothetical protein BZ136_09305 [Methanosphaera sp. rholeuAM74]